MMIIQRTEAIQTVRYSTRTGLKQCNNGGNVPWRDGGTTNTLPTLEGGVGGYGVRRRRLRSTGASRYGCRMGTRGEDGWRSRRCRGRPSSAALMRCASPPCPSCPVSVALSLRSWATMGRTREALAVSAPSARGRGLMIPGKRGRWVSCAARNWRWACWPPA